MASEKKHLSLCSVEFQIVCLIIFSNVTKANGYKSEPVNTTVTLGPKSAGQKAVSPLMCSLHAWPRSMFCYDSSDGTCHTTGLIRPTERNRDSLLCYRNADLAAERCAAVAGYTIYGDRCLKMITTADDYQGARDRCAQDGALIYHFKNRAFDQASLAAIIADKLPEQEWEYELWIGADDLETEGTFYWGDGSLLPSDSDAWYTGGHVPDPNNEGGIEDCVAIDSKHYAIFDRPCNERHVFVCDLTV